MKEKLTQQEKALKDKDDARRAKAEFTDFIAQAKEGKKRKFNQTVDMIISLKNLDLKKPENRFSFDFQLPAGKGKKNKIAFIGDSLYNDAKGVADTAIAKADIERLGKDRKGFKKLVDNHDFFLAEAPLMPAVGKSLGVVLGTRGKMPMPVPPKVKVEGFVAAARNYVRIALRNTPVIQVPIGSEDMKNEDIKRNFDAVYNAVRDKLPKGVNNIRATYVKLTMGKPVKVEM